MKKITVVLGLALTTLSISVAAIVTTVEEKFYWGLDCNTQGYKITGSVGPTPDGRSSERANVTSTFFSIYKDSDPTKGRIGCKIIETTKHYVRDPVVTPAPVIVNNYYVLPTSTAPTTPTIATTTQVVTQPVAPVINTPVFQPITQIATNTTKELITINLKLGSKGDQVKLLQKKLNVEQTGYFGNLTRKAVVQFQKDNNILATGNVFSLTREALNR